MKTQQELAVLKTEGPCIILAGAGTGKSYTVKEKIKHLTTSKIVDSSEILCLTFSNEATNSLREGIAEKIGSDNQLEVKTFHSFCSDILREDGHLIGVPEDFELLLPDDAKVMVHKYLGIAPYWSGRYVNAVASAKDFGVSLDDIKWHLNELRAELPRFSDILELEKLKIQKEIELRTIHLMPGETVEERRERRTEKKGIKEFVEKYDNYKKFYDFVSFWEGYEDFKKERKYIDFSDLNELVLDLFNKFDSDKYVERFKYVFVDEFRDTNKLQFGLIEFIAKHHNITVVGDPNQSIYGFRGSYKESFEHFKKVFKVNPETDIFRLEKCYRSPNTILNISYDLIKNNYENIEDCLLVQNANDVRGDNVKIASMKNKYEEARYIADLIEEKIKEGIKKEEICVLYRNHKHAEEIKEALDLKNIPVVSAGKTDLLQTPEIKTVIAHLGILSNLIERTGTGEQAWWDLFHYSNNLSPEDSVKIGRFIKRSNRGTDVDKREFGIDEILLTSLSKVDLSDDGKRIVKSVVDKLKKLIKISNRSVPELILETYNLSGLNRRFTTERSVENIESLMNLKKFYEVAKSYYQLHDKTLQGFLHYLEIMDKVGVSISKSKATNVDAVKMMTIHASKGLEFDCVFVCSMATDRFPVSRVRNEALIPKHLLPDFKAEMETWGNIDDKMKKHLTKEYDKKLLTLEERRLCYVAFTRAKKELYLTYAKDYKGEENSNQESMFLNEIKFKENENCDFIEDENEFSTLISPNSQNDIRRAELKTQVMNALDTDDLDLVLQKVLNYISIRKGKKIETDLSKIRISDEEILRELSKFKEDKKLIQFSKDDLRFSPSSIITYNECPKKYELSQLYQMPERGDFDSDKEGGGATLGSFVHLVLEEGVNEKFKTFTEFTEKAAKLNSLEEWKSVDLEEAIGLIKVFWERNKGKYNETSVCELPLGVEIGGYKFYGLADRVDYSKEGKATIIDYKTNKNTIPPKKRRIQLGFYGLVLKKLGHDVEKLTLDMLKLDSPVVMDVDSEGNVKGARKDSCFTLDEVEKELIETCENIEKDYCSSFAVSKKDDPCKFCGYKFYCPKWEEK